MALADQFNKSKSSSMINTVMKKADDTEMDGKKRNISLDLIDLNEDNEYIFGYADIDFLAMTIDENGFNGAIEVWAKPDGRYEISSGHRRYLAMKELGKKEIPCIVYENVPEDVKVKKLIFSNIHNRDLTPLRRARAIQYYADHVLKDAKKYGSGFNKRAELQKVFNISNGKLENYLNLLKLIPEFQEYTDKTGFPYTNFLKVVKLDEQMQRELYHILTSVAENGDLGTLSGTIINQYVQKLLLDKENKEKATIEKIKSEQLAELGMKNNSDDNMKMETAESAFASNISSFGSFQDDSIMNQHLDEKDIIEPPKDDYLDEHVEDLRIEEESTENNIGGEMLYLIHKMESLVSGMYVIKEEDSEECVKLLEKIISKISK